MDLDPPRPTIPKRSKVPGSRAVVGGLLVAVAVGVTLQAGAAADRPPETSYLVADADLDVGVRLRGSDVGVVAVDLPEPATRHALPAGTDVTGAVALGPIRRGQLLAGSDLLMAPEGTAEPVREVSVPVPAERALDGRLAPGELIDVLATAGTGPDATTERVATSARVLSVGAPDDSLARAGIVVLTLAIATDEEALAIAHASATAELTVVRGAQR